jgi:hypothetical protein
MCATWHCAFSKTRQPSDSRKTGKEKKDSKKDKAAPKPKGAGDKKKHSRLSRVSSSSSSDDDSDEEVTFSPLRSMGALYCALQCAFSLQRDDTFRNSTTRVDLVPPTSEWLLVRCPASPCRTQQSSRASSRVGLRLLRQIEPKGFGPREADSE